MRQRVSTALLELPGKPHALYRFFDRTDVLLYIGVTADLPTRITNHRRDKRWWLEVHHITIEHFSDREVVMVAEAEAIRTERPLYNVSHNEIVHAPKVAPQVELASNEPCDEDRDAVRRTRHEGGWHLGRQDLAQLVMDDICGVLGDARLNEAITQAADDLSLPEDERRYYWENDERVVAALALTEAVAHDVWRFQFVLENLLGSLPPRLRRRCEEAAAADWRKAGHPDAHRLDQLPDILRHLGYLLWGRPNPQLGRQGGDV